MRGQYHVYLRITCTHLVQRSSTIGPLLKVAACTIISLSRPSPVTKRKYKDATRVLGPYSPISLFLDMATFAQQTQQMAGEPASSTSVTTNSFSTLPSSSSSTTDIIQPILAITNALSSITLHSPIRASSPPAAPSTQVASALALCQTSPPRAPKTSNDVRDGVVAVVKEVTSTEDAAQKTVGPTQHPDFTFDDGNVTLKVCRDRYLSFGFGF